MAEAKSVEDQLAIAKETIKTLEKRVRELSFPKRVQGFNLNALFNDRGTSKNTRHDEVENAAINARRKEENAARYPYTAYDVAEAVVNRAVIVDDWVRLQIVEALAYGLMVKVPDPYEWQNGPRSRG